MSKIEWTDKTWNPITGCTWQSSGCDNCYAKTMARRLKAMGQEKYQHRFSSPAWHEKELSRVFGGNPKKIFVNSMGDLFHDAIPFGFIKRIWNYIAANPQHTFQILTKRPERMFDFTRWMGGGPWPGNAWLGVTVEKREFRSRMNVLADILARVRFVSFEPLLEDIKGFDPLTVNWVIVGAETGPGARPMNSQWARDIKRTCGIVRIPFFMKKMSGGQPVPSDLDVHEFPSTS